MENINPIVLSIPVFFILIGIELIVQFFTKKKLYRLNDAITNISCGITQQLTGLFLKVLSVGIYFLVFEYLRIFTIPVTWYTIIILFMLIDLCYYWAHRMSHEINLFWGGHVVHHQSEDYNLSVALRQGSFQVIWTFAFYLPLAVLGFDPNMFVLLSAFNTLYQFWIHTETINKLGPLEWVFNTPSHHRVHHGRNPKYIDKNHAGSLIIWDRMFGTFQAEEERPTYGITTPTNSWNPVWANLKHYKELFGMLPKARSFPDAWKMLFNKPGWYPDYLGGPVAVPEVDRKSYQKYNVQASKPLQIYVLVQYGFILAGTALFLFKTGGMSLWMQAGIVAFILFCVAVMGGLLENKSWSSSAEVLRLIALLAVGGLSTTSILSLGTVLLMVSFLSLITFLIMNKKQVNISLLIFIGAFLLSGCVYDLELDSFDQEGWKADAMGCNGDRDQISVVVFSQKDKIRGGSPRQVKALLGTPDAMDLFRRNQQMFVYYITPGGQCSERDGGPETGEEASEVKKAPEAEGPSSAASSAEAPEVEGERLMIRFNAMNRANEIFIQ